MARINVVSPNNIGNTFVKNLIELNKLDVFIDTKYFTVTDNGIVLADAVLKPLKDKNIVSGKIVNNSLELISETENKIVVDLSTIVPTSADNNLKRVEYDNITKSLVFTVGSDTATVGTYRVNVSDLVTVASRDGLKGDGSIENPLTVQSKAYIVKVDENGINLNATNAIDLVDAFDEEELGSLVLQPQIKFEDVMWFHNLYIKQDEDDKYWLGGQLYLQSDLDQEGPLVNEIWVTIEDPDTHEILTAKTFLVRGYDSYLGNEHYWFNGYGSEKPLQRYYMDKELADKFKKAFNATNSKTTWCELKNPYTNEVMRFDFSGRSGIPYGKQPWWIRSYKNENIYADKEFEDFKHDFYKKVFIVNYGYDPTDPNTANRCPNTYYPRSNVQCEIDKLFRKYQALKPASNPHRTYSEHKKVNSELEYALTLIDDRGLNEFFMLLRRPERYLNEPSEQFVQKYPFIQEFLKGYNEKSNKAKIRYYIGITTSVINTNKALGFEDKAKRAEEVLKKLKAEDLRGIHFEDNHIVY